jgi:threonine dehydratase
MFIYNEVLLNIMAKSNSVSLPSGQGGLIGGVASSYKTKFDFGPKFVVYFSIAVVIFVWVLFNT